MNTTSIAQSHAVPHLAGWKLAACATLSLALTLLTASFINRSVISGVAQSGQPPAAIQTASPLPSGSALPMVTVLASR
jgi:hypothetical protein